jgi:mannose/cellobiose epimerase-like protein (N-acyl-D-glucosamine 2-epimerase family)
MLGGKCQKCGYNKCFAVFDFHHINPEDRHRTRESREYIYKFFEKLVLDGKIQLLCANCHREKHYGEK